MHQITFTVFKIKGGGGKEAARKGGVHMDVSHARVGY
jgi:hypothetical protein